MQYTEQMATEECHAERTAEALRHAAAMLEAETAARTAERDELIVRLHAEGWSLRRIGACCGLTGSGVQWILRQREAKP